MVKAVNGNDWTDVTEDEVLVTKRLDPGADLKEIWHIHKDDIELKQLFAKVLCLDPVHVTVVHIMFSPEESMKKVLLKKDVMTVKDIVDKLKAAEGKIFS